jgi:YegS/Rv2252/BmrU family lipid kinase
MSKIMVVLNPIAGRGYAGRIAPLIVQHFAALGADFDLVETTARGEAIDLTRRALDDGYETLVAVGGDGTSHEMVNAMMMHNGKCPVGKLGCIPAGSGNDFAVMNGAPENVAEACRVIVEGRTRRIDLAEVTIDDGPVQYLDNTLGIGFDGLVTRGCLDYKRLRGMALYLPVVLKTVFVDMQAPEVEITYDGNTIHKTALMTVICNGPREGAAFRVAPGAQTDDGLLDLLVAEDMPRLGVLSMIPRFMKGTHLSHKSTELHQVEHVVVTSEDPLYLHMDGEIVCDFAHRVEARVIPGCLEMVTSEACANA